MDYEKKYKDLVKAVKELQEANPSDDGIQNWVNENVPELKESGDEKIREWLIFVLSVVRYQLCGDERDMGDKALAWLEAKEVNSTDAFIKKACEAFCKVRCNSKPPRITCVSLGTCLEHDQFRKALKGE